MRSLAVPVAVLTTCLFGLAPHASAQQPAPAAAPPVDHVAALKQNLGQGSKALRQYEWVETTIINLKGEEKGRKQNRCYYGADGQIQKIAMEAPAAAEDSGGGGGRRGGRVKQKIVENKKDEYTEYMQRAAALIHSYVPPAPPAIQAVKDAGRLAVSPQPGGAVRLTLPQYLKAGDSLTLDVDGVANRLLGLAVDSYLDTPDDKVTLAVQMTTLPDGAIYASRTALDAPAKKIQVVITNTGHRPMAR